MQSGDLRAVTRVFGSAPEARLALIRAVWPQVVGEQVARHTEVASLTAELLRVRVADPRWRKVLPRMRRDILSHLRQVIGALAPQQIGLLEGPLASGAAVATPRRFVSSRSADAPQGTATSQVTRALTEASQAIEDLGLRREFLAAATRYLDAAARRDDIRRA
jgi:hypothetical protein